MTIRRADHNKEDHVFGLKKESDLQAYMWYIGQPHYWYNVDGESSSPIDFDLYEDKERTIFTSQICCEGIGEKRADRTDQEQKLSFRISIILEQFNKPHPVFYVQVWFDGSVIYFITMQELNKFLEMDKGEREEKRIFRVKRPTKKAKGKLELFLEVPLDLLEKRIIGGDDVSHKGIYQS